MRIMLDTNVLISILLFPNKRMEEMIEFISINHDLVLSSYVIDELKSVVNRKFPGRTLIIDNLLTEMSYDLVYTPDNIPDSLFQIRDKKDYPVLYTAIIEGIDILITGDKDFADVDIIYPKICTPADFIDHYMNKQ